MYFVLGQYGKVRAVVRIETGALLVPQTRVTELQGSYQADVVGPTADRDPTGQVGDRIGTMWIIEDGLKAANASLRRASRPLHPGMIVHPSHLCPIE